jgi:phosphopantetheine adenylyltransferase
MGERIGVYPGTFDPITLGISTSSVAVRSWSIG